MQGLGWLYTAVTQGVAGKFAVSRRKNHFCLKGKRPQRGSKKRKTLSKSVVACLASRISMLWYSPVHTGPSELNSLPNLKSQQGML